MLQANEMAASKASSLAVMDGDTTGSIPGQAGAKGGRRCQVNESTWPNTARATPVRPNASLSTSRIEMHGVVMVRISLVAGAVIQGFFWLRVT